MTGGSRIRLRITGRVQGVGFRWFVREQARRLGVSGWVRNEEDGSVLLEAEGPADVVGSLQAAVALGPRSARVESVESVAVGEGPLPRHVALDQ